MKIFLDTSYFLNLIKLKSPKVPDDFLLNLMNLGKKNELLYSTITIFELQALAAKKSANKEIDAIEAIKGIQSLIFSEKLTKIEFYSSLITQLAIDLRSIHIDFIDCIILASAIINSDILISEDGILHKILETDALKLLLKQYDIKDFKIYSSLELTEKLNLKTN